MLLSWDLGIADAGCDQLTGIDGSLGVSGPAVVVLAQEAITCSAYNALMFGIARGAVSRGAASAATLSLSHPSPPLAARSSFVSLPAHSGGVDV